MRKSITSLGVLSLFLMGGLAYAQVSGVIKDSSGLPLEEAEVVLDRTGASVLTDANGAFTIDANIGDTLRIIDINGEERTIKVASNKIGDIKLAPSKADEISLSTVNLVGGVKMDASQKVGAYDIIKKEDFELAPTASIDEVLNGRVAGLVFSTNSGDPGSTNIITIRGVGSIIGTTNPLYVIDGVVVGKGSDNAGLMESWNPLASIDPNMIEDVTVLKDASATALYGARGANGVIVIKTKKGKYGAKTRFNLSTDMAIQDIAYDKQNWMNANEYIQWGGLAYFNTGGYASRDAAVEAFKTYLNYDGFSDTDWQGAVMRNTASVRTYNFSASGGSENTSFRVGGSFYENKPLVLNSNFERLSVNSAIEHKIEDKFNFGMNLNFTNVDRTSVNDGGSFRNPWLQGWAISPTRPIYNQDGSYNQLGLGPSNDYFNPVALQNTDFLEGTIQTYLGSVHGEWQFAKNFYFYTLFGAQYQSLSEKVYWGPDLGDGRTSGGYVNRSNTGVFDWNWQNSVSYRKLFKDVHDIQAWAGIEYQEHKYNQNSAYVTELSEPRPYLYYGTVRNYTGDSFFKWTQISYFSRANYTYNNKFTLSAQLRRDSNSTLGINDKSGVFWSVGANYNIAKESFAPKFLSTLTVRANYGEIGNIPYADNWGAQYNAYSISGLGLYGDSASTESISTAGDPDLKWEVSKQWNVGADFGILKDKLVLGVDVYDKRTVDAIYSGQIPLQNGSPTSYYTNIGKISNKGVELTLNARPINKDFRWNVYGNFAYNKNILEALTEDPNQIIAGSGNGIRALGVGHEIGEYYTYTWAGVDRETGAGLYYTDETQTATTTNKAEAKRVWQGVSPFPKYTAGLKNEFAYKGFSVSVFFTGQFEYAVHNMWQNYVLGDGTSVNYNQTTDALYNSWTPENRDAKNPIQIAGNTSQSQLLSSRWMRDGDHIRLKEAKVAYSFGDKFKQQTGIHNLTIYAKGVNLWLYTFDEDLTFDPESNSNAYGGWAGKGLYDYTSPIMKSISLGISVDF
jgi:TonB-linked SusC/RagA family outer membrane protein